jgi:exodeoxyribonuclease V gamma subunit
VAQGLGSVASLQSAVERLAFGAVLPPGLELEGHPIPAGMVEGMRLSLLGSFTEALDLLGGIIRGLRGGPMPVASWCEIANELVDALAAKTDAAEAQQLRETLAGLQREGGRQGDAAPALEVNLVVWAAMLSERLTARRSDEVRGGGGITLASLVPMRAIPFRVVVLLGLDGQLFPRVARRDSVDPMRAKPRRGDPDARDEDRHLFLEALCAAREAFWVFCSAVDADSGEKLPLSAPVDELLDTLDATIECNGGVSVRSLLLEEAQQEPRIPAVEPPAQDDPPPPAAPDNIEPSLQRTITVRNLYRAVAEPLSEYASTTLRIRSEGCDPLPEAEPSVFSRREKSSLTRELLLRAVREPGLEVEELKRQTREHLLRQGAVAQGNLGRVAMASLFAAAQHPILALRAEQIRESAGEPEIIDVGGGTMLTVPQPWRDPNGDPVLVVPRLERGRYRLEIWVNLLCNAAAFNDTCLRVYGPDLTKNATAGGRWHRFEVPDRAEERLAALATMRAVALGRPFRASVETLLADSVITSAKDQHEDPDLVNLLLEVAAEHADAARASKGEGYDKKLSYASPPELLAVLDAPWPRLSETEGEGATVWDADALRWMTEVGLPLVRTLRVEPTKSKKGGKP